MADKDSVARLRRRAGLVIAGTGVYWLLVILIGEKEGFSQSLRLGLDLVALAGFLFAFWLIYKSWRAGSGG
ncbi:MAG: DUF5337 family protein [Pseudomonadota bacterium]